MLSVSSFAFIGLLHFLPRHSFQVVIALVLFRRILLLLRRNFNLRVPVMEKVIQQRVDCFYKHIHQKHHRDFFQKILKK